MARVRQTVLLEVSWDEDEDGLRDPSLWPWQKMFEGACKDEDQNWIGEDHIKIVVEHGGPVVEVEDE